MAGTDARRTLDLSYFAPSTNSFNLIRLVAALCGHRLAFRAHSLRAGNTSYFKLTP